MLEGQTVVYTARTVQDAHRLKNLLAQERIDAVVLTDTSQLSLGVDSAGWATAAGVAVAEKDAQRAKQLAVRFDRKMATSAGEPVAGESSAEEPPTVLDVWPQCPECDARRSTRCPVCHTAGTDFPQADMGFVWIPGPDEATTTGTSCNCGSQGCAHGETAPDVAAAEQSPTDSEDAESPVTLLVCSTCDEPFQPEYPRLCEWCGHEFDDGFEMELPTEEAEQVGSRAIAVIVGLLVVLAGVVGYFTFILQDGTVSP